MARKADKRFKVPRRTCRLVLDGDFKGAEAVAHFDVDLGIYFDFAGLEGSQDAEGIKQAMRRFGDIILISWNLEDEAGEPLPATADGFMRLPLNIAQALMGAWVQAVQEVPAPLEEGSTSGATSLADSSTPLERS